MRKFAFTYFLYRQFNKSIQSEHFEVVTFKVIEKIKTGELYNAILDGEKNVISYKPFKNKEELIAAVRSAHDDFYFFSNSYFKNPDGMQISLLFDDLNNDELLEILNEQFAKSMYDETVPGTVADFALLEGKEYLKNNQKFFNMGCSNGSLILKYQDEFETLNGVDINQENVEIAKMRMYANLISGEIRQADSFKDAVQARLANETYDFVFGKFPWRINYSKDTDAIKWMQKANNSVLPLDVRSTSDFYFISAMFNYMSCDSVGVAVVPLSTLSNISDYEVRKTMVQKGYLREIISLPAKIFDHTDISTALIIFGKKPVKKIAFFDASSFYKPKDRVKGEINVSALVDEFKKAKENETCYFDEESIKQHEYSLSPSLYLHDIKEIIPNGTDLCDVAEIFTGWQVSSAKLEEIHKTDGGGVQLVQMSNVEDGTIKSKLERYDVPIKSAEKFSVQKGDVVISTKSLKVKSAVIDLDTDEPIIASGSIMVLRPKKGVLDPYFLVSYFESDLGKQAIRLYQTGSVIPNLSINNVKKIPIPLLSYEKQVEIGKVYKDLRDLIISEKQRLESLEKKVSKMLDNLWDKEEE